MLGIGDIWKRMFQKPELEFVSSAISGIGGRSNMEDACGICRISETSGCWVVADGVGGYKAGEVASNLAVQCLSSGISQSKGLSKGSLRALIEQAHQEIVLAQFNDAGLQQNMATTVVALLLSDHACVWAHVGDSRLYRFRSGRIDRRTKDHSLAQMLVDKGELKEHDLRSFPQRNVILQALGQSDGDPEVSACGPERVKPGDVFLLCTDGFWEPLSDAVMEGALGQANSMQDWLQRMEAHLIATVEKRPRGWQHHDNYTAMAIQVNKKPN